MRHSLPALIMLILLSACSGNGGIRSYWNKTDLTVTQENYREAEDRFAEFAEQAVSAPFKDASAALDKLFNRLKEDEVSYFVYSEWVVSAFHSILSPCRNPALFAKAVDRFSTDGIMTSNDYEPLQELVAKDKLNIPGAPCTIPELTDADGFPAPWTPGEETVFLVLNLDCATCVSALRALSTEPGRHIALCYGHTPAPAVPGWDYRYSSALGQVFDVEAAPFWFTVDAIGNVVKPIAPAPVYSGFAKPDNQ